MTLAASLTHLETSGLLRLAQVEPELEYLFRHALIQDAAYESILKADRRILHRAIGETLERLYPDRVTELAPVLGQHFVGAGEAERARKYFTLAGDSALAAYANVEAEQHYRAALDLGGAEAERAHLLEGLGGTLFYQGRFAESVPAYQGAIQIHRALNDSEALARAYARVAWVAWYSGGRAHGLALCREGLEAVAGQPESAGLAELLHETGRECYFASLVDEARRLCDQALPMAERLGLAELQVGVLATMGILPDQSHEAKVHVLTRAVELTRTTGQWSVAALRAHVNLANELETGGEIQAGLRAHERALELARWSGLYLGELWTLTQMALDYLWLGDFTAADELRLALRRLPKEVPASLIGVVSRLIEALFLRHRGEIELALPLLQNVREETRRSDDAENNQAADNHLAEACLETGALDAAENALTESLALVAAGMDYMGSIVWVPCLLSVARVRQGRLDEAGHWLAEARDKATPQPTPIAQARLAWAEAHLALTQMRWREALAAFEVAAEVYQQIGMRWYRAQALREWAEAHLSRNAPNDVDRARELLREAQSEFEAMNVPRYAALVRERLAQIG